MTGTNYFSDVTYQSYQILSKIVCNYGNKLLVKNEAKNSHKLAFKNITVASYSTSSFSLITSGRSR